MKNGTDFQNSSFRQLGALAGFIVDFLATVLNVTQVTYWLGHKNELKKKLREVFSITDEFSEVREEWKNFYKINFGWDVDFNQVVIPPEPTEGKWRLLFIPKGMTSNFAFQICKKLFASLTYYDNLDKAISKNIRDTSTHYAVWVHDEVEPDQEFLGKSSLQSDPDILIGITLLERIIFEIKYFTENRAHLDIKGVTFCSGSRNINGNVLSAGLDSFGNFLVYWRLVDNSDGGIRQTVSLENLQHMLHLFKI